ncbi:putative Oxidoreductase AflY [Seiridium cardinale]
MGPSTTNPATAYSISLSPVATAGSTNVGNLTQESADKVSELLMINNALYHARFNDAGFHNHIVHHLLALWALGSTPAEIQDLYDYNKSYQAPLKRQPASVSVGLKDKAFFRENMGKAEYYADFVRFFQDEIAERGVPDVVNEYLLKGDEFANDIFGRMHSGFMHPLIHLGCGIEFQQPCTVAESLAAACIHDDWPKDFLFPTEEYVNQNPTTTSKPLLEILDGLRNDPEILTAVRPSDPLNKISDGLMKRAKEQLVPHLAQFRVQASTEDIKRQTKEMMYTCTYMTGAAQRPGKKETLDFIMMHAATTSVFYPAIMAQDWISDSNKARLLEAKARSDAVMYAGCGSPALYPDRITEYTARHPADGWPELIRRANKYRDDGHVVKMIRALFALETLEENPATGFPLARSDFIKIAHLTLDAVERANEHGGAFIPEPMANGVRNHVGRGGEMVLGNMSRWVYYTGLEGSWDLFPSLETSGAEEVSASKPMPFLGEVTV